MLLIFINSSSTWHEKFDELKKSRNELEGQLDLEKGTVTYNPAIKEQMEQQAQQGGRGGNNGVDGGEVVDSPFVKV